MRFFSLVRGCLLLIMLATIIAPSQAAALATPQSPLGVNLEGMNDWSDDLALLDFFKTSREWIPQCRFGEDGDEGCTDKNNWDTEEYDLIDVDNRGWVRSLPKPTDAPIFTSVSTLIMMGDPRLDFSGEYVVLYKGQGTMSYHFLTGGALLSSQVGRDVIRVERGGQVQIKITATDPNNTGNYLRDFHVVPVAYETTYTTQIFDPRFLDRLGPTSVLRFMDWMRTNETTQREWTDRPVLNDARYTTHKGVPLEIMTALSNRLSADAWFNMPHTASDDYTKRFATRTKNLLNQDVDVYVEFSNEVWNSQFPQYDYAITEGKIFKDQSSDEFERAMNWHGMRTAQMCDIWKTVWADQAHRVRCVAGSQASNNWVSEQVLGCSLWDDGAPCVDHGLDAVAVAPYFGGYLGDPTEAITVSKWTLNKLFTELQTGGIYNNGPDGGALAQAKQWMVDSADTANDFGVELIAYEGGQHLAGFGGAQDNKKLTALFVAANRDPRMEAVYRRSLDDWRASGGHLFVAFNFTSTYDKWGSWGALEYVTQPPTPKWKALTDWAHANPCWWEGCN